MKSVLRFQDLKPERDEFELEDGTKVAFVSRVELDGLALAKLDSILREILRASRKLVKKQDDERTLMSLGKAVDRAILLILPELPNEVLQTLGLDQKTRIFNWWRERNAPGRVPDKDGQGEAGAG